jgi:hypothetical protein
MKEKSVRGRGRCWKRRRKKEETEERDVKESGKC